MDKKSSPRAEKILLALLLIITIVSLSYTFYKTVIKQDFAVVNAELVADEDASQTESEALDIEASADENAAQEEYGR